MGLLFPRDIAKDILNHSAGDSTTFRRHYSKNIENYALPALRLGEVAGPTEKVPGEKAKVRTYFQLNVYAKQPQERAVREGHIQIAVERFTRVIKGEEKMTSAQREAIVLASHFLSCVASFC